MKSLFLLCGPSGSGKSTWAKRQAALDKGVIISRDVIRFALLKEGEDYFAHEDEVFDIFIKQINEAIAENNDKNIYIDATHLNEKSRNKVLDKIDLTNVNLIPVNFIIDLEVNFQFNDCRTGRAFVPRSVISRMRAGFVPAGENEKHKYADIINVF